VFANKTRPGLNFHRVCGAMTNRLFIVTFIII